MCDAALSRHVLQSNSEFARTSGPKKNHIYTGCAMLRSLDMSFNQIASSRALLALRPCVKLETVALNDNPVSLLGTRRRENKKRKIKSISLNDNSVSLLCKRR